MMKLKNFATFAFLCSTYGVLMGQRYDKEDVFEGMPSYTQFIADGMYFESAGEYDRPETYTTVKIISPMWSRTTDHSGCYYEGDINVPGEVYNSRHNTFHKVRCITGFHRDWVTSIRIPPTASVIPYSIFQCDYLEKIVFDGEGMKEIWGIFDCPLLKTCEIPQSVETIKYGSFCDLPLIDHFRVPESLTDTCQYCFNNNARLLNVILPARPVKMRNCFNGCERIESITVLSPEPYDYPKESFMNVDKARCVLYVPEESIDAYRSYEGWNQYTNILPTAVSKTDFGVEIEDSGYSLEVQKGVIRIVNNSIYEVKVYDLTGRSFATAAPHEEKTISLPNGIYIATDGRKSVKILTSAANATQR